MTQDQYESLQLLASGLKGTIAAMDQLSHDRAVRDQMTAAALYMSAELYRLVHGMADEQEQGA